MNKVFEFIWYLLKSLFGSVITDLKEMFEVVTKKKTWVVICFMFLGVSIFLRMKEIIGSNIVILALSLFVFFFITYEWQVFAEEYTHQERVKFGYDTKKIKEAILKSKKK